MATTNDAHQEQPRETAGQPENRGNSAARESVLDDTTLDTAEGSERAKQGRTDRATGSAEPMNKDEREAAQGRS